MVLNNSTLFYSCSTFGAMPFFSTMGGGVFLLEETPNGLPRVFILFKCLSLDQCIESSRFFFNQASRVEREARAGE